MKKDYSKLRLNSGTEAKQQLRDLQTQENLDFIYKENEDEILSKKKYPFYIIIDKIKNKIGISNFSLLDFQKDEYEKSLRENTHANSNADTLFSFLILILIIILIIVSFITF